MFLFWLFLALAFGAAESMKDSYDAYKYHNSAEYQRKWGQYANRK